MNDSKYTGSGVLTSVVMKSYIFGNVNPCSPLKVNQRLSTLKMEVMCSSEMSINLPRTT
jgi:hypothetical protein